MRKQGVLWAAAALTLALPALWLFAVAGEAVPDIRVQADTVVIDKSKRHMTLLKGGQPVASFRVALGRGGPGPKRREGDNRVPEGDYLIEGRNPRSSYHLSLRISYPSPADTAAAEARGETAGNDIMIHGIRNGLGWFGPLHELVNWTAGCVTVTNAEMDAIWRAVPDGTPVKIRS